MLAYAIHLFIFSKGFALLLLLFITILYNTAMRLRHMRLCIYLLQVNIALAESKINARVSKAEARLEMKCL
jgi:hypothetical protein